MRIRFIIRKARMNQINMCPINCRITINGIKANEFATGIFVDPAKWESKQQRIKGNIQKVQDQNKLLDLIRSEIDEIYLAARSRGVTLSAYEVKDIYTGKRELECRLSKLSDLYLKELFAKERAKATIDRYTRCYKYLADYLKKDLPAYQIERRHVSGFWLWLKGKKYHADYCNKIVQACIGLFRFGIREGYVDNNPFAGSLLEWKKELDITYLTNEEIEAIKCEKWSEKLQKVADSFLFMSYTGLHISDYQSVEQESVYLVDKQEWMKVRRVKTNVVAIFPLHKYAKYLIEKYGGINNLPKISGQKSNDYLKLIAEKVKITKNLTNKIARKTFTNMALNEYNMSLESVAAMLGHTTTRQVKHYGAVSEKRIYSEWKDK